MSDINKPDFDIEHFNMSYSVDTGFDDERFLKLRLRVCHDGVSPNKTYFTKETMEKANDTIAYIPILANVKIGSDGKPQLSSHDMHVEEDKLNDGEYKVIYDETPIGLVPASEINNCTIEEFNGKNYTFVDCYIWREYSNYAEQLLEDAVNSKLSMEISIPDEAYSYNAKEKYWVIDEYKYRGITFLNPDLGTGMTDALGTTASFSAKSQDDIKDEMIVLMSALQECLLNYNENLGKGGNDNLNKLEELLQAYSKTLEDLTFEYDGLSDEELETKFKEAFDEAEPEDEPEATADGDGDGEPEATGEGQEENPEDEPEATGEFVAGKTFSKDEAGNVTIAYQLSHDDIRSGLYTLLRPYEEADEDWYYIDEVYDDHFDYGNWGDKNYRQSYTVDGDTITFVGERLEIFIEKLTASEKAALDEMRTNYSAIVADKEKADKEAVFNNPVYAELQDNEAFKTLRENAKDYSLKDIERECKVIFAEHTIAKANFSLQESAKEPKKKIGFNTGEDTNTIKPYGDLWE